MKKLLTVLLTLVMAIGLVVLNNNHTKAEEENSEYTYTFINDDPSAHWDSTAQTSYNAGDKITLKNQTDAIVWYSVDGGPSAPISSTGTLYTVKHSGTTLVLDSEWRTATITEGPAEYIYTYTYDSAGNEGSWNTTSQPSYSAGKTIAFVSPSTAEIVNIYVNGNYIKAIQNDTHVYTVNNNGTVISLGKTPAEHIAYVYITDTAPAPTPTPSEPVVKDESCEKVIGPTWHWNESKGICEDYGVVGTSTR